MLLYELTVVENAGFVVVLLIGIWCNHLGCGVAKL
jgi:hypothetical protein